jgi:hypothetical protein
MEAGCRGGTLELPLAEGCDPAGRELLTAERCWRRVDARASLRLAEY